MLVSVIVPCYNYGHLLSETLDSILKQSLSSWECIVVDDGSSDNTFEVSDSFVKKDKRFRYIYQKNAGLSAARNTGIFHARGDYFQFLDADDLIVTTKLEKQAAFLQKNPEIGLVYGKVKYFETGNPEKLRPGMYEWDQEWMPGVDSSHASVLLSTLLSTNIFAVNCPLIRKTVLQKIGWFNTELRSLEDWEYWLRCAFKGVKFSFCDADDDLALVRCHSNSMSKSQAGMKEAAIQVRQNINYLINECSKPEMVAEFHKINHEQLNYQYKTLFELYAAEGQKTKALVHLMNFCASKSEFRFFIKSAVQLFLT